ncbi:MAG: hypothetical protein WD894_22810 [Pirellulales bacterium]
MPNSRSYIWFQNRLPASTIIRGCLALLAISGVVTTSQAAPQIKNVNLRGIQSGGTTVLAIDGEGLTSDTRLVLGLPVAAQNVKPSATDRRIEVELTLPEKVPSGLYLLRALNADGVSNGVPVGVDSLSQSVITDRIETLPAALTGSVSGDQSTRATFVGKKGETITVEIEARRLLSELNPVMHLYDARGVQVAWAQSDRRLAGDARLTATLAADGEYTVEVHDALYQGRSPGYFRLKIGQFASADMAYPSAIKQGTQALVQLLGTNLDSDTKIEVQAPPAPRFFPVPGSESLKLTGIRPTLSSSEFDEAVEAPSTSGDLQTIAVPSGIHGRLLTRGEEDRFRITAAGSQKLRLEVYALRLGSPLDAVLTVYDTSGKNVLATNDDQPRMSDSALDFTAPADAKDLVVGLKDLIGRGGGDYVYRLTVLPQDRPDFSLALADERVNVPRGGRALVRVAVERRGYNGPIDLSFDGLPPSIAVENAQIAAGNNIGLVLLSGSMDSGDHATVRLVGRATEPPSTGDVIRTAMLAPNPLTQQQPWLREEIAVALAKPAPLQLAWEPATTSLPLGDKLSSTVKATRAAGMTGAVRLSLVTTQQPPKKTIKENNQDKQVDDVGRTLRLEGTPAIAADQTETVANTIVPADLPEVTYGLVLRGELLSADGKQVVATAYAPVLSARPARPVSVALSSAETIEARAGLGETGKFTGSIARQAGFNQPLRVTLEGLPAGVPSPFADVAADANEFELAVRLPHGMKAEALKNVYLVAVSLASPGDLENAVRTNRVPVTLNVVAGEKPPAEPPLRIFEDEEEFANSLNQGGGQVRLEGGQKYSGAASVRVTPDQRFNPALPSLGVKIRKDPGAGEYRYLRFAWRKQGGNQICLQLNHDGAWGPMPGGTGAKFRYHAGPGDCFGASLRVNPRVPNRMTLVTRDLYADFGEFTLTGLGLSPIDGQFALFDHIYLGRTVDDLDSVKPEK